jgi:protein-S-isoprenylcysteine O-methyltransferase Ste14
MTLWGQFGYALAWISFGLLHSLLAHPPVNRAMARVFGAGTRLVYNLIATLHIVAVLLVGLWLLGGSGDFALPFWLKGAMWAMALGGVVLALAGLREYDGSRFLGTWQLRHGVGANEDEPDEPLVTAGLHAYVRHPLYTAAFLLLWGLAQSPLGLATAVWGSLYLLIGTWFEERKLLRRYEADYRAYRARVPAFIPWKGRAIPKPPQRGRSKKSDRRERSTQPNRGR